MKKIICAILVSIGVFLTPSATLAKDTGTTENTFQKFESDNGNLKEVLKREMAKAAKKYNADSATAILESPAGIEVYKYEKDKDKENLAKKYSAIAVISTNSSGNTVYKFESLNGDITLEEVQKQLISGLGKNIKSKEASPF